MTSNVFHVWRGHVFLRGNCVLIWVTDTMLV
jgi:hypothetical protein